MEVASSGCLLIWTLEGRPSQLRLTSLYIGGTWFPLVSHFRKLGLDLEAHGGWRVVDDYARLFLCVQSLGGLSDGCSRTDRAAEVC